MKSLSKTETPFLYLCSVLCLLRQAIFHFTAAGIKCSVAAVENLPVHFIPRHTKYVAGYIVLAFSFIRLFVCSYVRTYVRSFVRLSATFVDIRVKVFW